MEGVEDRFEKKIEWLEEATLVWRSSCSCKWCTHYFVDVYVVSVLNSQKKKIRMLHN
jgi:hypothetical protein